MTALERKGFAVSEGDHTYYIYHTMDGRKTLAKTKVSHSGKDIADAILGMMARQCKLTTQQFRELVDCPLSRKAYEGLLAQQGLA
jgi:hypothetical protein